MCLSNYYTIFRVQPERIYRSLQTDPTDTNDWSVWHGQAAHSQQILKPTVGGHWTGPLLRDPMSQLSEFTVSEGGDSQPVSRVHLQVTLTEQVPPSQPLNERICHYSKDYFLITSSNPLTVYYLNSNIAQVFF